MAWALPTRRQKIENSEEKVMWALLRRFGRDESGATAIEYALIAGSIGLAIVTVALEVGQGIVDVFTAVKKGFP